MYSIHSTPKSIALNAVADGWIRRLGEFFFGEPPLSRPPQVFIYRRKRQRQHRMRVA